MSKRNVSAIKQDTPAFLKRFKEQIGYKDGPKLSDKLAGAPQDYDERDNISEPEDEQPIITGITKEEIQKFKDCEKEKEEIESTGGRIMFKKPKQILKKANENKDKENKEKIKDTMLKKENKMTNKNKKMLSFDDDDEVSE